MDQLELDAVTPLLDGCSPEDTRPQVTLMALHMHAKHKMTDPCFHENMSFLHERLPKGNKCPTSFEEAKKIMCPLDLPHVKYHVCMNNCIIYRDEHASLPYVRCAASLDTRRGRKLLENRCGTFRSLLVCSGISRTLR